jgi:hypothetical protein
MIDHSKMKLGRKAVKTDSRTLRLARYLTPDLPAPPPAVDWTKGISDWGMMLNNSLGDCTCAACGHAVQVWSANAYHEITPPDSAVLKAYQDWCGYNPNCPSSDAGGVELDVLTDWKNSSLDSHILLAFASVNHALTTEVQQAIALFGGVYIGVSLPLTAQSQDVWDVVSAGDNAVPGSWGGHAVYVCGYDQDSFTCITWGQTKKMTLAFWQAYVDESYALLGLDWINAKSSPSGLNINQLQNDLAAIR